MTRPHSYAQKQREKHSVLWGQARRGTPELELLSSESEPEDEEPLSSESDDELLSESEEDASRFLRFLEPLLFLSSSPPAAAPRASGSSSLGSRNRGRACKNRKARAPVHAKQVPTERMLIPSLAPAAAQRPFSGSLQSRRRGPIRTCTR